MNVYIKIGFLFAILVLLVGSSCAPQKKQDKQTINQGSMIIDDKTERPNRAEFRFKYSCGSDKFEFSFVTNYGENDVSSNEILKIRINGRQPANHSELKEFHSIFSELKEPTPLGYPVCQTTGSRLGFVSTVEGDTDEREILLALYLLKSGQVEYSLLKD